jgi:hypothetical protein
VAARNRSAAVLALAVALAPAACGRSGADDVAARRAKTTAEVTGFVVQDQPGGERRIVLDLTVRSEAKPPLEGVTLDVSIAGPDGKERERRRIWVETRGLGPGGIQLSVPLEDVDYRPGDGYWVEVRNPVPAAERGEYREFAAGGAPG